MGPPASMAATAGAAVTGLTDPRAVAGPRGGSRWPGVVACTGSGISESRFGDMLGPPGFRTTVAQAAVQESVHDWVARPACTDGAAVLCMYRLRKKIESA